ncbi:MAG TPA: hypothetical protein VES73_12255 [Lamprocystis sp. (in: g-proteobacteria)]|nr:hypothetical protein [Lamprocystis sp. (in: g-proteobacteria)]
MSDTPPVGRRGARPGAGRKPGSGPFGEPTLPVRLPVSLVPTVRAWLAGLAESSAGGALWPAERPSALPLPLYGSRIAAGFPSLRIPRLSGHRFHGKLDTQSSANWTVIPGQTGHRFQGKLDT